MKTKRFPFAKYRLRGDTVRLIHHVGRCAVALVFPEGSPLGFYALRYRQFYAEAELPRYLPAAFAELRLLDNAEIRRENEVLTADEALTQLDLTTPCFEAFCDLTGLNPAHSYTRRNVRRAIVAANPPKMSKYLSLLDRLTPTATKLA